MTAPKTKPPTQPKFQRGALHPISPDALEDEAVYRNSVLDGHSLGGRRLSSVSFEGCVFRDADLSSVAWHRVRLADVRFERCNLAGARLSEASLERVELTDCRLLGAQLPEARLRHVHLIRAQAHLSLWFRADARNFWAQDCDFEEATFMEARLPGAVFRACRLSHADFSGAALAGADFRTSALASTRLGLREVAGITVEAAQLTDLAHLLAVSVVEL